MQSLAQNWPMIVTFLLWARSSTLDCAVTDNWKGSCDCFRCPWHNALFAKNIPPVDNSASRFGFRTFYDKVSEVRRNILRYTPIWQLIGVGIFAWFTTAPICGKCAGDPCLSQRSLGQSNEDRLRQRYGVKLFLFGCIFLSTILSCSYFDMPRASSSASGE